ncbi:MAG: ATP-binding protein [Planctomycetota bacterium]
MINIKILIATVKREMGENIANCLKENGFTGITVVTGSDEVLPCAGRENPGLAILDVNLSPVDGFQLCKALKDGAGGHGEGLPVVLLTDAPVTDETLQRAASVNACGILHAPFSPEALLLQVYKCGMSGLSSRLAVSESQCRSLVNGMVDGALLLDSKGKVALINKAGEEALHLLGVNRTNDGAIVSINAIRLEGMRREMAANKQGYVSLKMNTVGNNEKQFIVTASVAAGVVAQEPGGIVVTMRDVTRDNQLQGQNVKSERLHAAKNLVAGAAHELNNPLAGIQLCTELVLGDQTVSEKTKKHLSRIQKESEQIQAVVKSLLTLTGNYTLSKEPLNVNEIIEEIVIPKASQFEYANISFAKCLDEQLPIICADKNQMRRVFTNIIENACASMSETTTEKRLTVRTEKQGESVKITISDTGPGIHKEYLSKIFEPFFSAKDYKKSKERGLGLSIAYSIVNQHNGSISADSEVGKGATFVIALPIG